MADFIGDSVANLVGDCVADFVGDLVADFIGDLVADLVADSFTELKSSYPRSLAEDSEDTPLTEDFEDKFRQTLMKQTSLPPPRQPSPSRQPPSRLPVRRSPSRHSPSPSRLQISKPTESKPKRVSPWRTHTPSGEISDCLSMVGSSAFLLDVHRSCGAVEGRLSHFLPRWLRTGWQGVINREKSLEILRHSWELNLGHGEDRQ